MKLYKYTSLDIGKQIISSSQIALSNLQYFNDPFDRVPVSIEDDLRKAIDILNGYMFDVKITKVFLGAAMSNDQKTDIRSIIPSEIEVVEMKISGTKYELLTQ